MGNSVLIKLQAEDNLTPKLQANMDKLGELYGKVKELETALKTLRNQKGGIVSGDIKSDIENVAKLQAELKALQKDGNSAQIKKKEAEINRAVNQEIINLTNSLREQRDERARLSIITEKSYAQFKKDEQAKKKDTKATQDNTGAIQSNNAVRNSSINSLVRHIRQVETLVVSVYGLKRAYDTLLGSGISLHRQIESQTAGIAALITANTRLASGSKDLIKHFKIASQTAEQTMKKIKTASVETAATFPELTAIFQQAVGGALGAGKAMGDTIEKQIDNTITLSKRMSNIASAIGMPMQQVNEEIRSIIEGTIDINSRIAKMIGITNEEIRKAKTEQDGLVKYLNEKLKPFDALADIQSFDRLLARIKDKIDNIKLEATEEAFKEIKKHLKDVDAWLAKNNGEIVKTIAEGIKALSEAIAKIVKFTVEWKDEITAVVKAFAVFKAGSWLFGGLVDFRKEIGKTAKEVGVLSATLKGLKINPYLLATAGALYTKDVLEEDARGYADKKYWERQSDADKTNRILYGEPAKYATTVEEKIDALEKRIEAFKKKIAETPDASAAAVKGWQNQIDLAEKSIKNLSKTSDTAKKDVQAIIQDLIAMGKVPDDVAKILEKVGQSDFSSKFDEQRHKITANIQVLVNYLSNLDLSAKNAADQLLAINTALGNLEKDLLDVDKKEAEERARAAKQAHDEAMRRAKEKADWQIKHAKAVGDTEKAFRLELQQYEKELQELISKGYITREQKADLLRQKEKEHHEKRLKEQKELDESFEKEFDDRRNAQKDFYAAIGDYQKAAVVAAELELKKLVELAQKAGAIIDKDLAKKLKKIAEENAKKGFEKFNKEAKKSFKDLKNSWANTVSTMQKTVDDGFFNFFIGKTKSLKKALKDMGTNLMRDFISPYARTLSQGISGGFGALLGGGSNLASVASSLGLAKNDSGGWVGSVGGTTVELSSTGEILRGASALDKSTTGLLNSISSLKMAYDTFTTGLGGAIASPFYSAGGWLSKAGFAGSSQFMNGIGNGASIAMGGNGTTAVGGPYMYGTAAGGAMVGGAVGYGLGALGDRVFGAKTYAPYTGAAAGAAVGGYAAVAGSLSAVPVWGWIAAAAMLAIGGMIGKSKITDWGYQVGQDLSLGLDKGLDGGVNNWEEKTKKSWFSKSVSNQTSSIDEQTQKMLNQYARATGTLLKDWTGGNFNLPARTYNKRTLIDEGFGGALIAGVMGKNYDKALSFGGNEGELEKTYRYWMEQAKQDKKETYDLLAEYVGKINSNIKNLKLESLNNSLEKMRFANDEALDALKTLNSGLGAFSNDIDRVGRDMAGQIEKAYREALKNDFSKETVQRYEALTEAYKKAKQAQDDYLKAILNFTQQIASAQASFYTVHGIDSSFMSYQSLYTRFRTILSSLEHDLDKKDLQGVKNKGDINSWAKHFLGLSAHELGGFLSSGNTELRQELLKILTEYQTQVNSTNGHAYWTKSMADLEAVNKQIEALRLAQQVQAAQEKLQATAQANLDTQRAQLDLLRLQKSAFEKLANVVQRLRDSVIDSATAPVVYQEALQKAREAFAKGDYQSKAFDNLSSAAEKQAKFLEETSATYAEYKFSVLKTASEIEGLAGGKTLEDVVRAIADVEGKIKKANETLEAILKKDTASEQLKALEQQRQALIESSRSQIQRMGDLLGGNSPMVQYLKDVLKFLSRDLLQAMANKETKPTPPTPPTLPSIPEHVTPGIINNGATTANGATLKTELERQINQMYLQYLGRSAEQSGLDFWKQQVLKQNTTLADLPKHLIEATTREFGTSNVEIWKKMYAQLGLKPFANGGVVTRPTRALIGEAGAEAIIPLKNGAVRAHVVGAGENGESVKLLRELLAQGKEILNAIKETLNIRKDTTTGQAVVVTIENFEKDLRRIFGK